MPVIRLSKYWCSVPHCLSDKRNVLRPDRFPFMKTVTFHPYPGEKKHNTERRKWLQLVRRSNDYDSKPRHRVCSLHFVDGKPTKENPFPTRFLWNDFGGTISQPKRKTDSINKRRNSMVMYHDYSPLPSFLYLSKNLNGK